MVEQRWHAVTDLFGRILRSEQACELVLRKMPPGAYLLDWACLAPYRMMDGYWNGPSRR